MGAGEILTGNTLYMKSKQKTFAVAVSRDMAPRSRIVAYFKYNDEIVSDALNFFVHDTQLMTVSTNYTVINDNLKNLYMKGI